MSGPAAQTRQVQRVYSEWCVKAVEIILAARISPNNKAAGLPSAATTAVPLPLQTSSATSFNLKVPELFDVRSEAVAQPDFFHLKTQRSFQVEIYLGSPNPSPSPPEEEEDKDNEQQRDLAGRSAGQLLERWTFTFFPAHPEPAAPDSRHNQTLVRKLGVSLRSLMCFARLLPAHTLCSGSGSGSGSGSNSKEETQLQHWRFREESWPPTSRSTSSLELCTQDFVSLQSSLGTLRLSVSQQKDLKSQPAAGPFKSTAAIGSQLDPGGIELEESYFTSDASLLASAGSAAAPIPTPTSTSASRLGKIAEEPESHGRAARERELLQLEAQDQGQGQGQGQGQSLERERHTNTERAPGFSSTSASPRQRRLSPEEPRHASPAPVMPPGARPPPSPSLSSRPGPPQLPESASGQGPGLQGPGLQGCPQVLREAPPQGAWAGLPTGLVTLGPQPQHRESACSSLSASPQTTPKVGPAPDPQPPQPQTQLQQAPPRTATLATARAGLSEEMAGDASCSRASARPASPGLGTAPCRASGTGSPGPGPGLDPEGLLQCPGPGRGQGGSLSPGRPWQCGPERPGHGSRQSSRGSTSRSPSLGEGGSLGPGLGLGLGPNGLAPSLLPSAATSLTCRGPEAGEKITGKEVRRGSTEAESEIRLFGMSDDEGEEVEAEASEDEDEEVEASEQKVAESSLQEDSSEANTTAGGTSAVAGAAAGTRPEELEASKLDAPEHASPQRPGSEASGTASPRLLSPLIAQLNPFAPPPSLDLPPSALACSGDGSAPSEVFALDPAAGELARSLLMEMGELVCGLQQQCTLSIRNREVTTAELKERLLHFKELASGLEARGRG